MFTLFFTFLSFLYAELNVKGYVQFDKRFFEDDIALSNMYNTAHVELKNDINDNVTAFLSTEMRFYDNSNISSINDLREPSTQYPIDFMVWEAYGDVYDFLIDGLDLRVGKQLISWGTADGLTPTNVLNPNDFTDILALTDTVPVFAVKLDYSFLDNYTLSYIWEPKADKISLPRMEVLPLFNISVPIEGMTVVGATNTIEDQAYLFKNSVHAVKLKGTNFNIDWSLSYYHGYEDVVLPKTVKLTSKGGVNVEEDITLASPRIHMIGFDLAGELASIGYWGEVGVFIPDTFQTNVILPTSVTQTQTLLDEPYVKYTVGVDYTFSTSTYVNVQYNHGFLTQVGKDNLEDYIFARVEQKLYNDKIKLTLGGIFNTDGFNNISNNYGLGIMPELEYAPYDNVKLALGAFLLYGKGDVLFAQMKDYDQIYISAKYDF